MGRVDDFTVGTAVGCAVEMTLGEVVETGDGLAVGLALVEATKGAREGAREGAKEGAVLGVTVGLEALKRIVFSKSKRCGIAQGRVVVPRNKMFFFCIQIHKNHFSMPRSER